MAGIPDLATLLELVAVLLATGVIAGLLAGLLGVGGGIVIVPVLFQMFELLAVPDDIRMHLAVGTSLTTIVATSLISARAHDRRGSLDRAMLRRWWPGILLGTLAGTAVAGLVRGEVLSTIFAVVALLVALYMALTSPAVRLLDGLPEGAGRWLSGGLIGGFSAMMGIGGGTLAVPFMSACGVPVHRAVGTAGGIGVLGAVPARVVAVEDPIDAGPVRVTFLLAGQAQAAKPLCPAARVTARGTAQELTVDDPTGFEAGQEVAVYRRGDEATAASYQTRTIDTVVGSLITLTSGASLAQFPADGDTWITYDDATAVTADQLEHTFVVSGDEFI